MEWNNREYKVYTESLLEKDGRRYFLAKKGITKYLASDDPQFEKPIIKVAPYTLYEKSHGNAMRLCKLFRHLAPVTSGIKKSFGFGDRLGLATSGHIKTIKGKDIFPVFAQQSIREMERTGRGMDEVLDDAMWGVFQAGYKGGYGADIDHVKKEEDVLRACEAGYTMYTIDPSDYVNDKVRGMSEGELKFNYKKIPERESYERFYPGKNYRIGSKNYRMDGSELMENTVTYARAIKHIVNLYNIIQEKLQGHFDFEASVDETRTPTTPLAHIFIVEELRRNGVKFTSLALRFIGEFEKGIDYIGDVELFRDEFLAHAAICDYEGGYKLSIHSASDKFSIYPAIGASGVSFHIKTAGTSWLEAVRLISFKAPSLYRRMHQIALLNFEKDRKSYHVTTDLPKIPVLDNVSDEKLPQLLNEINSRQLMHITYGSILKEMREEIYKALNVYENDYYDGLGLHLGKHLELCQV